MRYTIQCIRKEPQNETTKPAARIVAYDSNNSVGCSGGGNETY